MGRKPAKDDPVMVALALPFQLVIVAAKVIVALPLLVVAVSFMLVWSATRPGEKKEAVSWSRRLVRKVMST